MGPKRQTATFLTLRQLGRELEVKHQQLSRESRLPGFPVKIVRGAKRYDPDAVRAWRATHIKSHRTSSPAGAPGPTPVPADHPSVAVLERADASGVELARAACRLASRQVAEGAKAGALSAHALGDLKAALAELRAAEAAHLDLDERRRLLVPIADVASIMQQAVSRLLRVFGALEASIGTELSLWLADPAVQSMPADDRRRKVREFVRLVGNDLRTLESTDVQAMLATDAD